MHPSSPAQDLDRLRALDIRERCRMARLLQDKLSRAPRVSKQGYAFPVIDESVHQLQLKELKLILSTMEFSPAFHALLHARTIALADEIAKNHTSEKLRASWGQANDLKGSDLEKFVAAQCRMFAGPGSAAFVPSRIEIKPVQWAVRGYFNVASDDAVKRTIPPIVLNETELSKETVQGSYGLAFHEQMHGILWQLGLAAYHGAVPDDHPLYNDAVLMRERIKYGVEFAPYLPSAYNADPVEKACQHYEALFMERCRDAAGGNGLSATVQKLWNRVFSPGR